MIPTAADIAGAAARISGSVRTTPLVRSGWLSDASDADVWLKLETEQVTGSFKIRGATNAIARLRETHPEARTVTTASAGNHGLALAKAGSELGITVRVHVPATAPQKKKDALRRYGAVTIEAPTYDEAERRAQEEVARGGVTFISAYSHPDVIAGAGTVALEMLRERPELDLLIVPLGGGGLLSGTAIWTRADVAPRTIVGAEAEASPVFTAALAAGRPVTVDVHPTVADGLAGNMEPDSRTFPIVRDLVDRVVRVPEPAIVTAMADLSARDGLIAEGASATAIGALLSGQLAAAGRRVGIILSGSNVATPYN
ncbi:MAG TPA: pyridoxal-phosphate dependent enzyme [Vicinamibacterales bacterium]|nr:pyridoxal-phosphate dependent enzyme [Vicinamibacterales bacterium]